METPILDDGRDRGETPLGVDDLQAGRRPSPRADADGGLLPVVEDQAFADRWRAPQGRFADEPRRAVEEADELVEQVMACLAARFVAQRRRMEERWSRGEDAPAEE